MEKQRIRVGSIRWIIERFIREMNGLDTGTPVKELGLSHLYTLRTLQRSPIGSVRASALTKHHVIDHCKSRRIDVEPSTISHDVGYLAGVLKYAPSAWNDCDDISDAAITAAKPFLTKHGYIAKSTPRKRRPSNEELDTLIAHFSEPPKKPRRNIIDMACITRWQVASGRRIAETCRLLWDDWNRENRTILVRKMKDPRSRNKNKVVAIPEKAHALLEEMWPFRDPEEPRIFPFNPKSCGAKYTLAKKALGIENLRLHDSRRECYTRLVEDDGYSLEEAILVTGHETIAIAQRTYLAMKPENLRFGPKARREAVVKEAAERIGYSSFLGKPDFMKEGDK